jgi:ribonuclease P protein subunit POP4
MTNIVSEIVRGEMIGRNIVVIDAKNKSLIGIKGNVIDETKNTFVVETSYGKKTLLKQQITFETIHKGKTIRINGSALARRPEERISKRVSR